MTREIPCGEMQRWSTEGVPEAFRINTSLWSRQDADGTDHCFVEFDPVPPQSITGSVTDAGDADRLGRDVTSGEEAGDGKAPATTPDADLETSPCACRQTEVLFPWWWLAVAFGVGWYMSRDR